MPADRDIPLVSREVLGEGYLLLSFRHPEVAREARPGQFVMIKAGLSGDPPLRRPFSILAVDPASGVFSLFLKAVGPGSRALAGLAPGDPALCLGPLGGPFPEPAPGSETLLVAGGYGVAPFLFFCRRLAAKGARPKLFYGGRTAQDLHLVGLFEALGVSPTLATEDGGVGHRGRVTEPLAAHLDRAGSASVLYACGPDAMLHAVARIAGDRGLPAHVSLDPWMGCGIGTCLGCVVRIQAAREPRPRYRCACTEGPAFAADEVVWPGETASLARRRQEVGA
jgi:dihydroorotate dehydrogenase electron transfer subunit